MTRVVASMLPTDPVIGVAAGVFAVVVAIMAITGWCPAGWFAFRDRPQVPQNTLGFADAHEHVDLSESAMTQDRSSHVHQ